MLTDSESIQLSVVIPVYNSGASLNKLIDRLVFVLDELGRSYEIILVDDGSRDSSWKLMQQLRETHITRITIIELMRNFGQHNAIMCGLRESSGQYVITIDDDLQNPPEEIPKLLTKIENDDLDLVYGIYEKKKHGVFRNAGSNITQLFYRMVFNVENGVSAFRVIRRPLVNCILNYNLNFTYLDGLFAWNTSRIGQTEIQHREREAGESGYSLRKLVVLAINLFTNFSLIPLQFVSLIGITVATLGFSAGIYYAYLRIINNIEVPGFASVMIAIFTFCGLQLLSIGIIGEYLGRLHINVNRKPQYVERTRHQRIANIDETDKTADQ